jgi:hypothetical protein
VNFKTPEDQYINLHNEGENVLPTKTMSTWVTQVMFDNLPVPKFCVSVYLYDRAYGGAEEGGWWYNTYEPVAGLDSLTRHFENLGRAANYRQDLQLLLDLEYNKHRRSDVGSVLSEGKYIAYVDQDEMPSPKPTTRPYYE